MGAVLRVSVGPRRERAGGTHLAWQRAQQYAASQQPLYTRSRCAGAGACTLQRHPRQRARPRAEAPAPAAALERRERRGIQGVRGAGVGRQRERGAEGAPQEHRVPPRRPRAHEPPPVDVLDARAPELVREAAHCEELRVECACVLVPSELPAAPGNEVREVSFRRMSVPKVREREAPYQARSASLRPP